MTPIVAPVVAPVVAVPSIQSAASTRNSSVNVPPFLGYVAVNFIELVFALRVRGPVTRSVLVVNTGHGQSLGSRCSLRCQVCFGLLLPLLDLTAFPRLQLFLIEMHRRTSEQGRRTERDRRSAAAFPVFCFSLACAGASCRSCSRVGNRRSGRLYDCQRGGRGYCRCGGNSRGCHGRDGYFWCRCAGSFYVEGSRHRAATATLTAICRAV